MRRRNALALTVAAIAGISLVGCAAEQSGADSALSNQDSEERYATVLDDAVAALGDELPALEVALGELSVAFDEGEPLKIAFNGYGKGYAYSAPEYVAATDLAEEHGLTIDQFDPAGDPQAQITQVQDAMASGEYNAIVVYPLSTDLMCDIMTRQMPAAGILPIAIGNPPCTDEDAGGVLTVVPDTGGTDYVYPAWAELIAEAESGGKAIVVAGPEIDYTTSAATAALDEALAAHDVELLATAHTDFTHEDSLQKAQDIVQANRDATTIIATYPEGTDASVTALKLAGLEGVRVYDFGGEERILDEIKDDLVAGSAPFYPYTKVKTAIQALLLARAGETVDPYIPYAGHAVESMRTSGQDIMFVTTDNVDAFQADVAEY